MAKSSCAVLHVALNPITGPWSVMRELARAQARSGLYAGVGVGVIHDAAWPSACREELRGLGLPVFVRHTPRLFGTASFLLQAVLRPGIERWVAALRASTGAWRVVVHIHNAWMSGVFLPLHGLSLPDTVVIATVHGVNAQLDGKPLRHAAHRWMARRLVQSQARLTSVDSANLPLAQSLFDIPPERFTVIANGVPADTRPGCPFARGAAPVLTVGHVGSISERKGWHLAAEAVERVAATGRAVRLVIAGDGPEAQAAQRFADAHAAIASYRGFVTDPRAVLMPELDVLAVMSVHEGLPMTILEAQSAGVPSAATAVGGIPQAVREGESGFLVARTAEALAAVLTRLHDQPRELGTLSARTRAFFLGHFAVDRIVGQYHGLYMA